MFKGNQFTKLTSNILYRKMCLLAILSLLLRPLSFGQVVSKKLEQTTIQNQIILKLKPTYKFNISTNKRNLGLSQIDQIAEKQGTYTIRQIGLSSPKTTKKNRPNFENIVVLKYQNDLNIQQTIKDFEASEMLEYAEPNGIMYGSTKVIEDRMAEPGYETPQTIPNDQYYTAQWWSENDGTYHNNYQVPNYFPDCEVDADIDLEAAWQLTTGCSSVVIALLDTGMKLDHPEMANRIIGGYDFVNDDDDPTDDNGHGSNVGGIAFATGNNGSIHAGVNWSSDVLIVKVLNQNNTGEWTDLADGIIWAVDNGASIINISIAGQGVPQVLEEAVQYAYDNNVALIAAAGNSGGNIGAYPAVYPQTISVGATTCNDERTTTPSWGSNYHNTIDLVAPGSSIYSITHNTNNGIAALGGTSQATPMVAGVASLLLCIDPGLSVEDIRTILRNTADDQVGRTNEDIAGYDIYHGAGRLNAEAALLAIANCDGPEEEGAPCDDNDACTINDVYDERCICRGTIQDSDGDNVCDIDDQCPGFDDNIDIDQDNIPDNCDTDLVCQEIACDDNNDCTVNDVYNSDCNCTGISIESNGNCNPSGLYCQAKGNNSNWNIERVVIGNIDNQSGNDGGYGNYANEYGLVTAPSATVNVELTFTQGGGVSSGYWLIWIDFNQDYNFDESEKVVAASGQPAITSFTIPDNALTGTTLMRVAAYTTPSFEPDNACEDVPYGEFEDYIVIINDACTPGSPCDDSDPDTSNDIWQADCTCIGIDPCSAQGTTSIDIQMKVYLQGTYQTASGEMSTTLNTDRGLLPGQTVASPLVTSTPAGQPYSIAPWNYAGTEGADWTSDDYTDAAVDWVLVSLRTGTTKNTQVATNAGVLHKDGSIYFPDRCALSVNENAVYILIEHRNHVGIMTPQLVPITNNTLIYDFTQANTYNGNDTGAGQIEISAGIWAMYAGDADQTDFPSFDIKGTDKTIWLENNGIFNNYNPSDFNLDGDINGQDKSFWFDNNGISSRVPK